jgi:hypothetical protein
VRLVKNAEWAIYRPRIVGMDLQDHSMAIDFIEFTYGGGTSRLRTCFLPIKDPLRNLEAFWVESNPREIVIHITDNVI